MAAAVNSHHISPNSIIPMMCNHQGTKAPRGALHKGWHQRCRRKAGIGRRAYVPNELLDNTKQNSMR